MRPSIHSLSALLGSVIAVGACAKAQDSRASQPHVTWSADLGATLATAKEHRQPTLVFFTASWCVPCKNLKREVCDTPEFASAFAGHAFAMVDVDADKSAKTAWEVQPIPDVRFVSAEGVELGGFVGGRSFAEFRRAHADALASAKREKELRTAVAEARPDAKAAALLALGEHLLVRPTKRPALVVLEEALQADPDDTAQVAERAHWQIVGARFHPIPRPSSDQLADAQKRLVKLEALAAAGRASARTYADAVRVWLQWSEAMRAWSEQRNREPKNPELPLEVAPDAPLRATCVRLMNDLEREPGNQAAADGLLLNGMLHYYGRDYATGIAQLERFTKEFTSHRWNGEGKRFLAICRRLAAQGDSGK